MRYQRQYVSDADRTFHTARNSIQINVQKYGIYLGVLNWFKNFILKTTAIPICCFTRYRFGGSVFGVPNLVFFYFFMLFLSLFAENEDQIIENPVMLNALKAIPSTIEININQMEYFSINPISAIFTWVVLFIAFANMSINQLLPEEKKPNFFSRGISLATLLKSKPKNRSQAKGRAFSMTGVATGIERASTKYDISGISQRILEPGLFGLIGTGIVYGHSNRIVDPLLFPIGLCLMVGAISLFLAEMRADTHKARKR